MRLGERTWPEVGAPVVLVPLGSTEQHGPHLPLDTDTRIAVAVAERVAAERPDACVIAPALPYGSSGEHAGFPGTLSIGQEATELVLIELGRSADAFASAVVFVSGHGGNAEPLGRAVELLCSEGRRVRAWAPCLEEGGDLHAGRTETSLLLAIAPELVRLDRAEAGPSPDIAALRRRGVGAVSPSGVLGDPSGASADEGARLVEVLARQLTKVVDECLSR